MGACDSWRVPSPVVGRPALPHTLYHCIYSETPALGAASGQLSLSESWFSLLGPAACRARGLSSQVCQAAPATLGAPGPPPLPAAPAWGPQTRHTHVNVVGFLVPVPLLLHVGAQGRDSRGALLEGWQGTGWGNFVSRQGGGATRRLAKPTPPPGVSRPSQGAPCGQARRPATHSDEQIGRSPTRDGGDRGRPRGRGWLCPLGTGSCVSPEPRDRSNCVLGVAWL